MRPVPLDDPDETADEQSSADRQGKPGGDGENEEDDPVRHGVRE